MCSHKSCNKHSIRIFAFTCVHIGFNDIPMGIHKPPLEQRNCKSKLVAPTCTNVKRIDFVAVESCKCKAYKSSVFLTVCWHMTRIHTEPLYLRTHKEVVS